MTHAGRDVIAEDRARDNGTCPHSAPDLLLGPDHRASHLLLRKLTYWGVGGALERGVGAVLTGHDPGPPQSQPPTSDGKGFDRRLQKGVLSEHNRAALQSRA